MYELTALAGDTAYYRGDFDGFLEAAQKHPIRGFSSPDLEYEWTSPEIRTHAFAEAMCVKFKTVEWVVVRDQYTMLLVG